jgi:NAD(P)-dependent dehydrogenase (short-subunit alcohol dehydrogenase family)
LAGKVALITGGNAGIGKAAAEVFAAEGAKVVIAARRKEEAEAVVNAINSAGGEALFVATDVSKPEDCERMVKATVERFGRLDCAFNNAGILGTPFVPVPDYGLDTWERVIGINLSGVFYSMKYEIPAMMANEPTNAGAGKGAIVNMSSVAGLIGGHGGVAYYASKHGVIGATKAAALEWSAKGIRVNAVCPAVIKTDMAAGFGKDAEAALLAAHPIGRFGTPEEVAHTVAFLLSDKAAFITGNAYPVDGALLAR